jgi:hypothetical protein
MRVFMGPEIDASLTDGNEMHPRGSYIVKEMFTKEGVLLRWNLPARRCVDDGYAACEG